jgi:hypothetical protein
MTLSRVASGLLPAVPPPLGLTILAPSERASRSIAFSSAGDAKDGGE